MSYTKFVLLLALASQNCVSMQPNSEFPSPTVLRILGSAAAAAAIGTFHYSTKLAHENCPTGGDAFEQGGLGSFLLLATSVSFAAASGIAFLAASGQTDTIGPDDCVSQTVAQKICSSLERR